MALSESKKNSTSSMTLYTGKKIITKQIYYYNYHYYYHY
uniref:Uncharacterized protein n=1 Tax=Anguilla anguilla TaxID=7936 RepID=A0A0E9W9P4_ANGAN